MFFQLIGIAIGVGYLYSCATERSVKYMTIQTIYLLQLNQSPNLRNLSILVPCACSGIKGESHFKNVTVGGKGVDIFCMHSRATTCINLSNCTYMYVIDYGPC